MMAENNRIIRAQGFSLLELMIVVVIIGIVGAIASTSFKDYAISAKRTDARDALLSTAAALEKCKALYGSYNNANCSVEDAAVSKDELYDVKIDSRTATAFTLKATPKTGTSQKDDTECTSLSINHLGQQTAEGSAPDVCW